MDEKSLLDRWKHRWNGLRKGKFHSRTALHGENQSKIKSKDPRFYRSAIAALITVAVMGLFSIWPGAVEWLYLRSLFQVWRVAYDYTLGALPIPSGVWLMLLGIWGIGRCVKQRSWSWRGLFQLLLWLFSSFFWLWGFLYFMPSKKPDVDVRWSSIEVYNWLMEVQTDLETHLAHAEIAMTESEVRERLEHFLAQTQWPTAGRVRARAWCEGGITRYLGVSGIYLPWCMEGHLSETLPVEVLPFVQAHEMAHGYGIAREGEADYHAYKALTTPLGVETDAAAHWKAQYELWCALRRMLLQLDQAAFERSQQQCSSELTLRHQKVKSNFAFYTGQMAQLGSQSNAIYLKTMGMQDGLANYDRWLVWLWIERLNARSQANRF